MDRFDIKKELGNSICNLESYYEHDAIDHPFNCALENNDVAYEDNHLEEPTRAFTEEEENALLTSGCKSE